MEKNEHNKHVEQSTHASTHTLHTSTPTHAVKSEAEERKPVDSKKSLIIILIIIGIIILVIGAIFLSKYILKNKNTVTYNQYVFQKSEGNTWMTQQMIKGKLYDIPFYNNPTQVLDIPVDPYSIDKIRNFTLNKNGTVYVSIDPNESSKVVIAAVEYVRILGNVYNIYNLNVKSAFNSQPNETTDYPIVTCSGQSKNTLVIVQKVSNKNLISSNGNCITIESINASESIRVADAFAFKLLSIIPVNT
jgi:flagellar basal body-associated protein FliL